MARVHGRARGGLRRLQRRLALGFWLLGPAALDAPATDAGGTGFLRALYFSVQTFATIGYGRIAPVSHGAQVLVAAEAFLGIFYAALATGFTFARVSRPDADVVFSQRVLVAPYRGGWGLMFRLANARRGELSDVSVEVTFLILRDYADLGGGPCGASRRWTWSAAAWLSSPHVDRRPPASTWPARSGASRRPNSARATPRRSSA